MAIAFGAITGRFDNSGTGPSVSGSDIFGLVFAFSDTTGYNITGITWGGSSMTLLGTAVQTPGDRYLGAWGILNPSSSATITMTGGSVKSAIAMYYTGVNQSITIDSYGTGTSSASKSVSVTNTVVANNCWTIIYQKEQNGYTYTTNIGTMRFNAGGGGEAIADSNGTVSTGSVTMTLSETTADTNHGAIMISLGPVFTSAIKTVNGLAKTSVKTVNGLAIASVKTWNGLG